MVVLNHDIATPPVVKYSWIKPRTQTNQLDMNGTAQAALFLLIRRTFIHNKIC